MGRENPSARREICIVRAVGDPRAGARSFFFSLGQAKMVQLRLMRKRPMGERERQIRRVDRNRQIRRSTTWSVQIQTKHAEPSDGSCAHETDPRLIGRLRSPSGRLRSPDQTAPPICF